LLLVQVELLVVSVGCALLRPQLYPLIILSLLAVAVAVVVTVQVVVAVVDFAQR
jgi:hypothetical protein